MTLRTRLSLMLSVFLVVIAVLAGGTIMIFDALNTHMAVLRTVSEETKLINELDRNINDLFETIRYWGITGDVRYKKQYSVKLRKVYESFATINNRTLRKPDIEKISARFQHVLGFAREIMGQKDPAGEPGTDVLMRNMEPLALEVIGSIDELQEHSVKSVLEVAQSVEKTKKRMITYHVSLIAFTSLVAVALFMSIRRTIASPFNELLKATAKIGSGDLAYRIGMRRSDEFGVIAARFDDMASELEISGRRLSRKLNETELLLDIARMAGATLDRKDALLHIAGTLAEKLNYADCSIYMLNPDKKTLCLEASNDPDSKSNRVCLDKEDHVALQVLAATEPLRIGLRPEEGGNGAQGAPDARDSILAVPIVRDGNCIGAIIIRNMEQYQFSDDEINILKIASHTVGAVIRNAELYQAARNQIDRMTVLFDLSRAITSLLDLEELLGKIAEEVARLVSSRGSIIRLIEENKLRIKTSYGLKKELEAMLELSLGEGIAGWVAEHGEPMLVENADSITVNLKVPGIDMKTAICVPLKVGDKVIGTLSLYDKFDDQGALAPFTPEDLTTVEGFASISSVAIEKARIYEREISLQRRALEEKKRLNILFDSVQGGIITLDRGFTITSANKYIEDWTGMSGENLLGKGSEEIFHDRIGICPHCASKLTFETGAINTITQSRGVNYAELTAYPIRNEAGEVVESVVFIMDITERILYQEETLSLYREVIQTKEYLESIISNSADAIVTSDLDGKVTSWNQGAERIFGFSEAAVIGSFLPFVPDFLHEKEIENIGRLKSGEVLKEETFRKTMDGAILEVSLTLSPIKDAGGEVIGICGISRDISEKKRVEKELIRRNQEISRLFFISSAMRSTLELDKLLRMVLTAVTMSDGMGFNRAILFLVDEEKAALKGVMGVGPATPEEAWRIWDDPSLRHKSLDEIMQDIVVNPLHRDSFLERLTVGIEISLAEDTVLTRAVKGKTPFNVQDVKQDPHSDLTLIQQLGTQAYAVVPLISRDNVIGLIWVDNYFNRKAITDEDMKFLASFSNQIASAIENARLFEQVSMAEQQLENIFESMSDMVYFNSHDYVVKRINKAVMNRLGLPSEEIIGKKCYELFHGTSEPYRKCPHHKTVTTKKAYIEELDDPYLGGTFLTSSSPIFDTTGEFIGSVHVVRDITELKQLQRRVVMSEKMAALGEVAAKVAHEIRNPLVSIGGFAKRLEKKLDGNLQEYAGIIVREVSRLEDILKEILGFVKEVRLVRGPVNLILLVDEVVKLMESYIEEGGINLRKEYQPVPDIFVDANRVRDAIVNIITNAVQSVAGTGTVTLKTYVLNDEAVLEVRDTGRGIPEDDIKSIFNPFFTTKASGTGLGLAITHRIIQEHNGRIEVESEVDKGSVFRVYLPIKEEQA
jgi:PAS domain S-box-containing protein